VEYEEIWLDLDVVGMSAKKAIANTIVKKDLV